MELNNSVSFSHRSNPDVPTFPDNGPVVFIDGECGLCSRAAQIITRLDRLTEFRICSTTSPIGRAVLTHYGLDPSDPESWLYLEEGYPYTSLAGVVQAGRRLGGLGRLLAVFSFLPRTTQDWIYLRIARNRYRFFGRANLCEIPNAELKKRLIT